MFRSARFKLTMFYLGIILALSLMLSFGTRWLAEREYERSNMAQRGAFRGVITRMGIQLFPNDDAFYFQEQQQEMFHRRLNEYVAFINIGALIIGGFGSYIFAGWTLRPIEEAHERQKRFASDASHELRTPLTAMRTENEVFLRQRDFTEDEARELIASNLEEVDRLERLATNLLALTQYEDVHLALAPFSIREVVEEAIARNAKVHPDATVANTVPSVTILGHQDSLVQLFCIILDNACKYSPADKPISVVATMQDGHVSVSVTDGGKGIAEEDVPHVFDRLYRGDKARSSNVPGHGLGLALAKRIATANQATITAGNAVDGGAVFTVTLHKG